MTELAVLRTIALKGRVPASDVAVSLGVAEDVVVAEVAALAGSGFVKEMPTGLKTTPEGKERLADLLAAELASVDPAAMKQLYDEFLPVNAESKEIFTAWQLKPDGSLNDHADPGYDTDVLARLTAVHERVLPLVGRVAAIAPRAARYAERLTEAQRRYAAGESAYVTRPILDSYHTVWFELHEDLIHWCGLTRAEEAAAGNAH
ncbi:MarR family transcriptional regulator [Nocardioides marmoriginsengisoli]|uniref:MarR family transcriptional regulator n=1 Tax=Nocardioides marmoriginsengisoli TaxID=661483 RepID=A0A3N0CCB0_9ACTN|nr:MarR family transcriptional regulator [Nocardioides marmoriginsengisoli]RNL61078.1 MarR family transcriptional regulator [Nocardioides marmoriginsengisoli]